MKITRLKHAGFVVEAGGQRLGVDIGDFTSPEVTAKLDKLDVLVASHGHGDHYTLENVIAADAPLAAPADVVAVLPIGMVTHTLRLGRTLTLAGFNITAVAADHGPKLSRPIENYGLVIECHGQRIYYIGDMAVPAQPPSGPFDLVLVSVDGTGYVFDPKQAAAFVQAIGHAGMVMPIHDGDGDDPSHAERFAELASGFCAPVIVQHGETIEVTP
jgi:L-ascorbate metabolism protein UlaG (beta-lactamase superfamily)